MLEEERLRSKITLKPINTKRRDLNEVRSPVPGNPQSQANQNGCLPKRFRKFPHSRLGFLACVNEQNELNVKLSPSDTQDQRCGSDKKQRTRTVLNHPMG